MFCSFIIIGSQAVLESQPPCSYALNKLFVLVLWKSERVIDSTRLLTLVVLFSEYVINHVWKMSRCFRNSVFTKEKLKPIEGIWCLLGSNSSTCLMRHAHLTWSSQEKHKEFCTSQRTAQLKHVRRDIKTLVRYSTSNIPMLLRYCSFITKTVTVLTGRVYQI